MVSERHTTHLYLPVDRIAGELVRLPADETHHAVRVLRKRTGDSVLAVDGEGGWYRIELVAVGDKEAVGRIVERARAVGEPNGTLRLAMGLLKQASRFETFVEKAVELGVGSIVPLRTSRSERVQVNGTRMKKIAISAMKQSGRSRLPAIEPAIGLEDLLTDLGRDPAAPAFLCHEQPDVEATLWNALRAYGPMESMTVLIGPEGGFSAQEAALAAHSGVRVVSLGRRRLRSETAGIAAASIAIAHLEDAHLGGPQNHRLTTP